MTKTYKSIYISLWIVDEHHSYDVQYNPTSEDLTIHNMGRFYDLIYKKSNLAGKSLDEIAQLLRDQLDNIFPLHGDRILHRSLTINNNMREF